MLRCCCCCSRLPFAFAVSKTETTNGKIIYVILVISGNIACKYKYAASRIYIRTNIEIYMVKRLTPCNKNATTPERKERRRKKQIEAASRIRTERRSEGRRRKKIAWSRTNIKRFRWLSNWDFVWSQSRWLLRRRKRLTRFDQSMGFFSRIFFRFYLFTPIEYTWLRSRLPLTAIRSTRMTQKVWNQFDKQNDDDGISAVTVWNCSSDSKRPLRKNIWCERGKNNNNNNI